ncbi:MAG: MOSC N-terminal beta barrel domain-containing protein [Tahibacter sp.]
MLHNFTMQPTLSRLHIFPIKSCAPLTPDMAPVEKRGLQFDRRWLIVDADGQFLTGRQLPRLTLVRAQPDALGLDLDAPGMNRCRIRVPSADAPRRLVQVWKNSINAVCADGLADAWISAYLGREAHLVYMDSDAHRAVDPDYATDGDEVSFADAFPLLLISSSALDQLNARMASPVPMLRFRPNLVVSGTAPHAEDDWRRVRIGGVEFDVVKACTRCVFTTVDFERGALDPSGEPLRTLITYRRTPSGVTFGQNLIARGSGILRIGDAVTVLD